MAMIVMSVELSLLLALAITVNNVAILIFVNVAMRILDIDIK